MYTTLQKNLAEKRIGSCCDPVLFLKMEKPIKTHGLMEFIQFLVIVHYHGITKNTSTIIVAASLT
jgi:hypothetical protein